MRGLPPGREASLGLDERGGRRIQLSPQRASSHGGFRLRVSICSPISGEVQVTRPFRTIEDRTHTLIIEQE